MLRVCELCYAICKNDCQTVVFDVLELVLFTFQEFPFIVEFARVRIRVHACLRSRRPFGLVFTS